MEQKFVSKAATVHLITCQACGRECVIVFIPLEDGAKFRTLHDQRCKHVIGNPSMGYHVIPNFAVARFA